MLGQQTYVKVFNRKSEVEENSDSKLCNKKQTHPTIKICYMQG